MEVGSQAETTLASWGGGGAVPTCVGGSRLAAGSQNTPPVMWTANPACYVQTSLWYRGLFASDHKASWGIKYPSDQCSCYLSILHFSPVAGGPWPVSSPLQLTPAYLKELCDVMARAWDPILSVSSVGDTLREGIAR